MGVEGASYLRLILQPIKDTTKQLLDHVMEKGFLAGVMTIVGAFVSDHLLSFTILIVLVLLDQIVGTLGAIKRREFSSAKFRNGIMKLLVYAAVIAAFHILSYVVPLLEAVQIDSYAVTYLAVTEALSIVENARNVTGLNLPKWITTILKRSKT